MTECGWETACPLLACYLAEAEIQTGWWGLQQCALFSDISDRILYADKLKLDWSNPSRDSLIRSSWLDRSEVARAIDKIIYVISCLDRQRMLGEPRPRRDIIRHLARDLELAIRTFGQDGENKVLKCYDTDTEVHQLDIGHIWKVHVSCLGFRNQCAAFIVPSRKRAPTEVGRI